MPFDVYTLGLKHEISGKIPEPIYETLNGGWKIDSNCRNYSELPSLAKKFVEIVEKWLKKTLS